MKEDEVAVQKSTKHTTVYCTDKYVGCPVKQYAVGSVESVIEALDGIDTVDVKRRQLSSGGYSWTVTFLDNANTGKIKMTAGKSILTTTPVQVRSLETGQAKFTQCTGTFNIL